MEGTGEGPARNATHSVAGGITMSAGVVSPIGGFGKGQSESSNNHGTAVSTSQKPTSISEYRESKRAKSDEPKIESKPEVDKIIEGEFGENQPKIRGNQKRADDIFESAKKEGIDKTFARLANGEFIEEEIGDEKVQEKDQEEFSEITVVSKKSGSGESVHKQEISPLEAQVIALEERVNELMEENRQLQRKVAEAHEMAKNGIATALELARILKQIIEDEEEDKKKKHKGLLELVAKLIAQMLIMITVPEDQQKEVLEEMEEKAA